METEKLYLNDSLLLDFEAIVQDLSRWQDQDAVILDRSAFYGEAGGQLGDLGTLTSGDQSWTVVDSQYDDVGRLLHVLAASAILPQPGTSVQGSVALERRRDMMSQHTGQHLLSAAFDQMLDAATVSSRLGSTVSTLDLGIEEMDEEQINNIVAHANRLVLENRPIMPLYPNDEELAAMALRRLPKVTRKIRIVEIEGFDRTPCGGTHCSSTGQIGPIYVIGKERVKGNVRLNFLCGDRVLQRLTRLEQQTRLLGDQLGCGAAGVDEAVVKLQKDLKDSQQRLGVTRAALMEKECAALFSLHPLQAGKTTPIILILPDEDLNSLRTLSAALARRDDVVALLVGKDEKGSGWRVILDAGKGTGFDAGEWFKRARTLGGRGGGRAGHAEGSFPAELDPTTLKLD